MQSDVTIGVRKVTNMNCPICYKMVCVGDIRTMTRSGKQVHKKCYDRVLEVLGIERANIDCNVGWKHKKFWALHWNEHETPPVQGEEIRNMEHKFHVRFVKDDFVVLEYKKKAE